MPHLNTSHSGLNSSQPTSTTSTTGSTTLPPLPPHLIPSLLPYLFPPSPPLPPHLLTPLFRQTLLYLQPDISEMDRQLSAFPLPITTEALQRRLEVLSQGYQVGKGEYGWDGEAGVARASIKGEYGANEEDMDLHFQYNNDEGWGYHGLRIPGKEGDTVVQWISDPSSIDISPSSTDTSSSIPSSSNFEITGSLDPFAYSNISMDSTTAAPQSAGEIEIADYWAGFSPPSSPKPDTYHNGVIAIDEEERERQYWAQYSNAPSAAVSPAISRKASMMEPSPPPEAPEPAQSDTITAPCGSGRSDTPLGRTRTGTILPNLTTALSSPSSSDINPQTARPPQSPPTAVSQDISLLRDRLRMKTLSLLRRCWTNYLYSPSGSTGRKGGIGQGEKEEKGLRWLSLGREITSKTGNIGFGQSVDEMRAEDQRVRGTMELLWEMYEVYSSPGTDDQGQQGRGDGFYRLIEQALSQELDEQMGVEGGDAAEGGEGGGGIHRNYSFEQQAYWE